MAIFHVKLNVSEKEKELALLLANGLTIPKIAKHLDINRRTYEVFVSDVKSKYSAKTLAELVAIFLSNKFIKL